MYGRSSKVRPKVIDLNLVPLELRRPLVNGGTLLLVAALLAGVILLLRIHDVSGESSTYISDLERQISAAKSLGQKESERIAAESAEVAKLEQEVKRLKEETAQPNAKSVVRVRRTLALAPAVEAVVNSQSTGLRLTSLVWDEPKLTVRGRATSLQLLMDYAGNLRGSGHFAQVDLRLVDQVAESENPTGRTGAGAVPQAQPTATPGTALPSSSAGALVFALDLEVGSGGAR